MSTTRISGETGKPGEFSVPSESTPGHSWVVVWQNAATYWCGCPRFARTNDCRHVEAARVAFTAEVRALMAERRRDPANRERADAFFKHMEEVFGR